MSQNHGFIRLNRLRLWQMLQFSIKSSNFGEKINAMDIQLPKRIDGNEAVVLHDVHQMTVIGANGAGKTRFSRMLMHSCGDRAFAVSALKAIFPRP